MLLRANGDAREPALASRHPDLPDNAGSGDDLRRTARMSAKISMTHRWRGQSRANSSLETRFPM